MSAGHRFAFGHEHAPAAQVPRPAPSGDEATGPLPVLRAPAAPVWQDQSTKPLALMAAPAAPALPFRTPTTPAPRDTVLLVPSQVEEAVPIASLQVEMVAAPQRRTVLYVALGVASLALYSAALVALVLPRRAVDAPTVALAPSAAPLPAASASALAPVASVYAPALQTAASALALVASAPTASSARPPAASPARTTRRPAPTHTAQPGSDVRDPWSYQ